MAVVPPVGAPPLPGGADLAHRPGQLRLAPQGRGPALGGGPQHPVLLHADGGVVAQPHREPLRGAEEVRDGHFGPSQP